MHLQQRSVCDPAKIQNPLQDGDNCTFDAWVPILDKFKSRFKTRNKKTKIRTQNV